MTEALRDIEDEEKKDAEYEPADASEESDDDVNDATTADKWAHLPIQEGPPWRFTARTEDGVPGQLVGYLHRIGPAPWRCRATALQTGSCDLTRPVRFCILKVNAPTEAIVHEGDLQAQRPPTLRMLAYIGT